MSLSERLFYFRPVIIVADSGSTKTDWIAVDYDGNEILRSPTEGYNPMIVDTAFVSASLERSDLIAVAIKVDHVFFYGAGCSTKERNQVIEKALVKYFVNAKIHVEHDLLAAARAVCKQDDGVAAILGTGSNSCLYRNGQIVDQIPNLGYLLGDEGGGYGLGKRLMTAYMYYELSPGLCTLLEERTGINRTTFVQNLYTTELKNRYLASFAPFCFHHKEMPEIRKLVRDNFNDFIVHHLVKYDVVEGEKFNFVGSIASIFKEELEHCLNDHNLVLGNLIKNPIHALVQYHLANQK